MEEGRVRFSVGPLILILLNKIKNMAHFQPEKSNKDEDLEKVRPPLDYPQKKEEFLKDWTEIKTDGESVASQFSKARRRTKGHHAAHD